MDLQQKERVDAWGMHLRTDVPVLRPASIEELGEALSKVRKSQLTAGLRGAGCSYGDASLNARGVTIDFTKMARILEFEEATGVIDVEPGVTIEQLWKTGLPHGFWPPVVPGTMFPTLGGCAGMNIHGKNNFRAGTIGRHILEFDLMLADGSVMTCSRDSNEDVFFAAIGGFGMLGAFTRIRLQLKRVTSGDLLVQPLSSKSLEQMLEQIESHTSDSDYLVGWVDVLGGGRGLIHRATYCHQEDEQARQKSFTQEHQQLPNRLFWLIPKGWLWPGLKAFFSKPGMRLVNSVKYHMGKRHSRKPAHRQSLVGFSFLLDYVPRWKWAYKPHGLVQYQAFVPKESAAEVYRRQIEIARRHRILPFLGVLKRHQPEEFLLTHAVDGFSLALDFPIPRGNRDRLLAMVREMDDVVLAGGGRFYFAKDSFLDRSTVARTWPTEELARFRALKSRLDPGNLFQTDLSRRVLE